MAAAGARFGDCILQRKRPAGSNEHSSKPGVRLVEGSCQHRGGLDVVAWPHTEHLSRKCSEGDRRQHGATRTVSEPVSVRPYLFVLSYVTGAPGDRRPSSSLRPILSDLLQA